MGSINIGAVVRISQYRTYSYMDSNLQVYGSRNIVVSSRDMMKFLATLALMQCLVFGHAAPSLKEESTSGAFRKALSSIDNKATIIGSDKRVLLEKRLLALDEGIGRQSDLLDLMDESGEEEDGLSQLLYDLQEGTQAQTTTVNTPLHFEEDDKDVLRMMAMSPFQWKKAVFKSSSKRNGKKKHSESLKRNKRSPKRDRKSKERGRVDGKLRGRNQSKGRNRDRNQSRRGKSNEKKNKKKGKNKEKKSTATTTKTTTPTTTPASSTTSPSTISETSSTTTAV